MGDLIAFGLVVLLLALYGISQLWTWQRGGGPARLVSLAQGRQLAYNAPAPRLRLVSLTARPAAPPASPARYKRRDLLIEAGLKAGMSAHEIADAWHYTPRSTRRRVAVVQARRAAT